MGKDKLEMIQSTDDSMVMEEKKEVYSTYHVLSSIIEIEYKEDTEKEINVVSSEHKGIGKKK